MAEQRERAFGAGHCSGFQDVRISSRALDSRFVLVRADRHDVDSVRNGLAAERDIADRVFADVRTAECPHQSRIPARTSRIEKVLLQPAWQAVAEARWPRQ